jgi:fermentation-respiration switch protein FrsA (DUF1100 family)
VYFGVAWYVLGEALTAERNPFDHQPEDFNLTFEDIEFSPRGEPDITLRGWIFPTEGALAMIIWVHGLDKNRAARLSMMRELVDAGFAVLVFDLRGHGESDDVPIGAGFFETADVRGGIDFLLSERGVKPGKILLMGESLGAATVLMAGVGESAVVGVYADSGFASLSDVMIGEIAKRTPIPEWGAELLRPGIVLLGERFKGVEIDAVEPVEAPAQYDYPVGLAHCLEDERISIEHGRRIRLASPGAVSWTQFPRCEHADAYEEFPNEFLGVVVAYFDARLAESAGGAG